MPKVKPEFKRTLSQVESAGNPGYCYQCSACVAECPAAQRCEGFNPREIVLASILGVADHLTGEGSPIWQCTTCYKCYERCPQGTHPIEVITALKNVAFDNGRAPESVVALRRAVRERGTVIAPSDAVGRRRKELGLGELPAVAPPAEIGKILE